MVRASSITYSFYSLLFTIGALIYAPFLLFKALRRVGSSGNWSERLGRVPPLGGGPVIWVHCVSVGETQAAQPLIRSLHRRYSNYAIVVSTVTPTGQRLAREIFREEAAAIIYFPLDWAFSVRRALHAIKPSLVIIMETELWPRFLYECRKRGIPVVLANGRLSERSFKGYLRARIFFRKVINDLAFAIMQTEQDAARIRALGLPETRTSVSGNIKFDIEPRVEASARAQELNSRFALSATQLIVAASTHDPEERIVLKAFELVRHRLPQLKIRLLLAPRHPERCSEIAALLERSGFSWTRRTSPPADTDRHVDCILLDTIGELQSLYQYATIVFVGGSIAPIGGHNVLEPAAAARCIVVGAYTFNFQTIISEFVAEKALVQLPALSNEEASDTLAQTFLSLLSDETRLRQMGERAFILLKRNRGATERALRALAPFLPCPQISAET